MLASLLAGLLACLIACDLDVLAAAGGIQLAMAPLAVHPHAQWITSTPALLDACAVSAKSQSRVVGGNQEKKTDAAVGGAVVIMVQAMWFAG